MSRPLLSILPIILIFIHNIDAAVNANTFKTKMLNKHNTYRKKTKNGNTPGQPAAQYMKTLKWDANLAKVAQQFSAKCKWGHNSNRNSQYANLQNKNKGSVGENIYASTYAESMTNLLKGVTAWYNEYKTYTFVNGQATQRNHYSQLVNADTQYIGCGYKMCNQLSGSSLNQYPQKKMLLVCNYYVAGNGNNSPYKQKGAAFSAQEDDGQELIQLNWPEILAIVLGSVCLCAVVLAGLYYYRKRKNGKNKSSDIIVNEEEEDGNGVETGAYDMSPAVKTDTISDEEEEEEEIEIEIETEAVMEEQEA